MSAHLDELWKHTGHDRALHECIAMYKLDPWQSMQRECGIPSEIPVSQLSEGMRNILGLSLAPDDESTDMSWVDYLAIGIYVGIICCAVCLICMHFLVHRFPPIIRDVITAGMLLPVLVMAIVQITTHTNPYKDLEPHVAIKNIHLNGLQNCELLDDYASFRDLTVVITKDDNVTCDIIIGEARVDWNGKWSYDGCPGVALSPLEKHYVQEVETFAWLELKPILEMCREKVSTS